MPFNHIGNGVYVGLSTDDKSLITNEIQHAIFIERDTGRITKGDNTDVSNIIRGTGRKWGNFFGAASSAGSGIFAGGLSQTGWVNNVFDTVNGIYSNFNTGGVAGNGANYRYIHAYTLRAWNPYLGFKIMIGTVTNNRIHMGFKTTPSTAPADGSNDPLASISGVMIAQRAGDTTFHICSNNAGAGSTFVDTGIPINAATLYTLEIRAVEANTKFQYSINGSAWADITATIPAPSTALGMYGGIQTAEAVAHNMRIYSIDTYSDK